MRFRTLMLAVLAASAAQAGPIADKAAEAERLMERSDHEGALEALGTAVDTVWAAMPLTLRNVHLVKQATGYGVYSVRDDNRYRSTEQMLIYAEVLGHGVGENQLGGREIAFDVDIDLRDAQGKTVFSGKEVVKLRQPVRHLNKEFMLKIDLNFSGAPADSYVATLLVRDLHSAKSTTFDIAFQIIE